MKLLVAKTTKVSVESCATCVYQVRIIITSLALPVSLGKECSRFHIDHRHSDERMCQLSTGPQCSSAVYHNRQSRLCTVCNKSNQPVVVFVLCTSHFFTFGLCQIIFCVTLLDEWRTSNWAYFLFYFLQSCSVLLVIGREPDEVVCHSMGHQEPYTSDIQTVSTSMHCASGHSEKRNKCHWVLPKKHLRKRSISTDFGIQ